MDFQISDELKEKIETNFKSYGDLKKKLLSGDVYAIGQLANISQSGINPEDVIEAYESGNMDYLYNQAKKLKEIQVIYKGLCDAYASYVTDKNNGEFKRK